MDKINMLQVLFGAYPNTQPNEMTYAAYLEVFKDVPKEELWPLVLQNISNPGAFPPSAGDLLELWRQAKGQLPPQDGAEQAMEAIGRAVWRVGYVGSPTFDDPITERVVRAYGWLKICQSENPETVYAQLRKMYEGFARGAASQARLTTEYKRLVEDTSKRLEVSSDQQNRPLVLDRRATAPSG